MTRALVGHDVPSDSSHTLKSGYDVEREAWPQYALHALGVPAGLLPEVVRSGTRLGDVCEAAAEQTRIPAGTPVIAGMTDGCARAVRGGRAARGRLELGARHDARAQGLLLAPRSRIPAASSTATARPTATGCPAARRSSGAGVLTQSFPNADLDELGSRAAAYEDTRVLAYPLVSRGERFPFAAPNARPFVLGEPADEAEHFAALQQGVAFVERLCFDLLDRLDAPTSGELTLTGGGTRSRAWSQLRADVLGRAVRLVEQPEAAFGMAVLAASSAGGSGLAATADAMVRTRERIEPRPERGRAADGAVPALRRRARAARMARRAARAARPWRAGARRAERR